MAKTLYIEDMIKPDKLACGIAENFRTWDMLRDTKVNEWTEIQKYVFATDTSKTTNSKLPWSNKTTIPKLCQIRDNLFANYMATLFPRRKWLQWVSDSAKDNSAEKRHAIEAYMHWVVDRPEFYDEMAKVVLDYIDYGNCFLTLEWGDQSNLVEKESRRQVGYIGPVFRRISPMDIVFNPIAPSFKESPKIVRSLVSIGDIKELQERESQGPQDREEADALFAYMKELRANVASTSANIKHKDEIFRVGGFDSYRAYLESNYVEVLTFYGDMYDADTETLYKNHIIKVVDRHKVLSKRPNPSALGAAPIFHAGWRIRPDNIWAMGPLDNIVGMQYRIDHLENMKADVFDLIAYPPVKVKGYVEDFEWGPFERIYVGDDGDVELISPDVNALQADTQIAILEQKMEEMAGSPKEAMGFRSPGEKTAYEVQRIENAASRIFQSKVTQLERGLEEPALNAALELARRIMPLSEIRVFDDETKVDFFEQVTSDDIAGIGTLRPIAARNFVERATQIQNITAFYGSQAGADQDVLNHFSSIKTAQMWEELLDLKQYEIVTPNVRITERADAQRLANVNQEAVTMEQMTPSGIGTDFDPID